MSVSGEKHVAAGGGTVDRRRRGWSEAQKRQISDGTQADYRESRTAAAFAKRLFEASIGLLLI